ncbi:carbon-nitrogen family hydrolase [Bacillus sp. HMF5848]|nr:carbon-nitrogen family hydrolase [Bacillus sp. HMF5848]
MDIVFGDPEENITKVQQKIEQAVNEHSPDVIVLPELWTTGYDLARLDDIADSEGLETKRVLSALAKRHSVNIVAGSIAMQHTNYSVTNTMFVFNREGEVIGEYSKLHLFKLMNEHKYLHAGNKLGMFAVEGQQAAGVICYDIRFPEWIRLHATTGATIIFVVAQWPLPRLYHWRQLLISRAIENQCYIVACNRAGKDPDNVFAGHSMVIDPWGDVLVEADAEEAIISTEINISKVKKVRDQIPIFTDRRPELY